MSTWHTWSKKRLLELPFKKQLTGCDYYSNILIIPTKKQFYGMGYIALIGCVDYAPREIVCYSEEFKYDNIYKNIACEDLSEVQLSFRMNKFGVLSMASPRYYINIPINLTTMTEFRFTHRKPSK